MNGSECPVAKILVYIIVNEFLPIPASIRNQALKFYPLLFYDLGNNTSTYSMSTFTNSEAQAFVHRNRVN